MLCGFNLLTYKRSARIYGRVMPIEATGFMGCILAFSNEIATPDIAAKDVPIVSPIATASNNVIIPAAPTLQPTFFVATRIAIATGATIRQGIGNIANAIPIPVDSPMPPLNLFQNG